MLTFLFSSILIATPQAGAPPAAAPAAAKPAAAEVPAELKKAAAAVTDAKSYAFETSVESTGGMFGGRGGRGRGGRGEGGGGAAGGGAGAPPAGGAAPAGAPAGGGAAAGGRGGPPEGPQLYSGKFEKGKPVALKHDDDTVYRLDQQIVYSKDGQWEVFTAGQFGQGGPRGGRGGGAGGPAAGGGAPAPAGGGAPPAGGAPAGGPPAGGAGAGGPPGGADMRRGMSLFGFANLTLPHEVVAAVTTGMAEVKREEKDGSLIFSGALTADAADKLSGAARMREGMARFAAQGGGGAPEITSSGTVTITVSKDGAIQSIHLETKISGGFGGDSTRKVDVKLSGVGATTVDVPKEVLAKLST